jgi:PAS domain S-box-containing protein
MLIILLCAAGWVLAAVFFVLSLSYRKRFFGAVAAGMSGRTSVYQESQSLPGTGACSESEARFLSIFNSIPIGYFRTDIDGKILEMNLAFIRILGYNSFDELFSATGGLSVCLYSDPEERSDLLSHLLSSSRTGIFTVHFRKKDGVVIPCAVTASILSGEKGSPLYLEGVIEDITDRLRMQEVMIRTEKMATVAGLAAGMAHEINNPLGIIMQMAENAERRLLSDIPANAAAAEDAGLTIECIGRYVRERKIDQYLSAIREAGARAAAIVSSMVQFSRQSESGMMQLDLSLILDGAVELASKDYALKKKYDFKRISVVRRYQDIRPVKGVESQIQQVFLNILRNAAQSLVSSEHPVITITTSMEGEYSSVSISDNGVGIDEAVRERIFEPFFTTRPAGEGVGLGLSVIYYIVVNNHKGRIDVSSALGKGSTFSVFLPAAPADEK